MPVAALTHRLPLLLMALLLPLLAVLALQQWQGKPRNDPRVIDMREAQIALDPSLIPVPGTGAARLPLGGLKASGGVVWVNLRFRLDADVAEPWLLGLAYRPALQVYLDGALLAGDALGSEHRLVVGQQRLQLSLPPSLLKAGEHELQLRLAAPGPAATVDRVLLGPPEAVRGLMAGAQRWQELRTATAASALLVALFLALVAWVRRDEPLYAASSLHLALLALLLAPYVLPQQPIPSPWWRVLLDLADLGAKALLLLIVARLGQRQLSGGAWQRPPLLLLMVLGVTAVMDLVAAVENWRLGNFAHPWPWWTLGLRAALLFGALALALRQLRQRGDAEAWGTALLVGFSTWTWSYVTWFALVQPAAAPLVDSNALAHAGWVVWVALLLQRHFVDGARHEASLRRRLQEELAQRQQELEVAFEGQRQLERERAAAAQRQRLLQDLHDGLGSRLLALRVQADSLNPAQLAQALDECLLEMRLSVDSLSETEGDLGVLLGRWRQRVEPLLQAAGLRLHWRVREAPALACLRDGGALELVRWLQEATANVLRHAKARELLVATEEAEGQLLLWLVDDGLGLPPAPLRVPGQGLRSLQARSERLGAQLDFISPAPRDWVEHGVGTALCLKLRTDAGPR